jgi:hypothetical protein
MTALTVVALACGAFLGLGAGTASAGPFSPCDHVWIGPTTATSNNFNYPDAFATYWGTSWGDGALPAGAKIVLRGRFPHARYMSFNTYNFGRTSPGPNDSLYDAQIDPDPGATNGFRPGERRDAADRDYTITIVNGTAPTAGQPRPANTLYTGSASLGTTVVYRIYLPDANQGDDLTAGAGLPDVELDVPGQPPITDPATVCSTLGLQTLGGAQGLMPIATYSALRTTTATPGQAPPATHPAVDPPRWERWFNYRYSVVGYFDQPYDGFDAPTVDRSTIPATATGGPLSNKDASTMITFADRGFGDVLVIHGRAPTVPHTLGGETTFGTGDVRYWSFCQNELFSSKVDGCIADEQIPVAADGTYTVVTSLADDRPANATARCGYGFMPWSPAGDGAPDFDPDTGAAIPGTTLPASKGGRPQAGFIAYRQILPQPGFAGSIANVATPGTEPAALGGYLPTASYTTRAAFEARGCPADQTPPPVTTTTTTTPPPVRPPAVDRRAPRLGLRISRTQHSLHHARVRVRVRCDEACTATIAPAISVHGSRAVTHVPSSTVALAPNVTRTVNVRLAAPARNRLRAALRRHHRPAVTVVVRARDASGNAAHATGHTRVTG